jgi:hypothetical protein
MYRADAFTPLYSNTSARTGSTRACARDGQNRNMCHTGDAEDALPELILRADLAEYKIKNTMTKY